MKYLLDFGFTSDEIENLRSNIPPVLEEQLFNSYRLVSKNILFLQEMGINNVKEVFKNFYDMFLMDNSNFSTIFNKYEREDLVEKINQNALIVEFL